jgi:hypothetical protein
MHLGALMMIGGYNAFRFGFLTAARLGGGFFHGSALHTAAVQFLPNKLNIPGNTRIAARGNAVVPTRFKKTSVTIA